MDIAGSLCREQIAHIPRHAGQSPLLVTRVLRGSQSVRRPCWRRWFRGHVQVNDAEWWGRPAPGYVSSSVVGNDSIFCQSSTLRRVCVTLTRLAASVVRSAWLWFSRMKSLVAHRGRTPGGRGGPVLGGAPGPGPPPSRGHSRSPQWPGLPEAVVLPLMRPHSGARRPLTLQTLAGALLRAPGRVPGGICLLCSCPASGRGSLTARGAHSRRSEPPDAEAGPLLA